MTLQWKFDVMWCSQGAKVMYFGANIMQTWCSHNAIVMQCNCDAMQHKYDTTYKSLDFDANMMSKWQKYDTQLYNINVETTLNDTNETPKNTLNIKVL